MPFVRLSQPTLSTPAARGRATQAGFSLLEVLVTLTILAITSAVIFRSLLFQMDLVDRVERKSADAFDDQIVRSGFSDVVEALVPAWPEEPQTYQFIGQPTRFQGLTTNVLISGAPGIQPFVFELRDQNRLLYFRADGREILLNAFESEAQIDYLGQSGVWSPVWPPEAFPDPGPFDESDEYPMPPVPVAIRIRTVDNSSLHWLAKVGWTGMRIPRRQDLELGEGGGLDF
jgi:prepilin-type N-terminal cleavage/methylation domain-containing protein